MPASALDIVGKPGDSGTIEYEFNNTSTGPNERAEDVTIVPVLAEGSTGKIIFGTVTVKELPGTTSPVTIEPGVLRTFVIPYQIASTADDRNYTATLHVQMVNQYTDPAPANLDVVVIFTAISPPPQVGIAFAGSNGVNSVTGSLPQILSTYAQDVSIGVQDSFHDLSHIDIEGLGGSFTTSPSINLASIPVGTHNVTINIQGMAAGAHGIRAFSVGGASTTVNWVVLDKPATFVDGVPGASYPGSAANKVHVVANFTPVSQERIVFDPITRQRLNGDYALNASTEGASLAIMLRDVDGNVSYQEFHASVYGISQDTSNSVSAEVDVPGKTVYDLAKASFPINGDFQSGFTHLGLYYFGSDENPFVAVDTTNLHHDLGVAISTTLPPNLSGSFTVGPMQRIGQIDASGFSSPVYYKDGLAYLPSYPHGHGGFSDTKDFPVTLSKLPPENDVVAGCLLFDEDQHCINARDYAPTHGALSPAVYGVRWSMGPATFGGSGSPVFEGPNGIIPLAPGVSVGGITASQYGAVTFEIGSQPAEAAYKTYPPDIYYTFRQSEPNFYFGPIDITLPVTVPAEERSRAVIVKLSTGACGFEEVATPSFSGGSVQFTAPGFGSYAVAVRKYQYQLVSGPVRFYTDDANVTLDAAAPAPGLKQALNVFSAQGLGSIADNITVAPSGTDFNPPATIKFCYDKDPLSLGISLSSLRVYQFNKQGVQELLANQNLDPVNKFLTADVSHLSSQFNIFGATTSVPASDLLPPITTLLLDGATASTTPALVIRSTSSLSLVARDPPFPGAPMSGVSRVQYLLDQPYVSTTNTPGQPFQNPFQLSVGTHTLAYYAVDVASNAESVHITTITVEQAPQRSSGGLGIGRDGSDQLWTIINGDQSVALARVDAAGVLLASTTLPDAKPQFQWNVFFDEQGRTFAIGTAESQSSVGRDLAVYRMNASGNAVASSKTFDSGFSGDDYAFDAAPAGWISGAAQIGESFSLALWHFNPATESIQLSTTYARGGGFDVATGLAVDASGNIWAAGFTQGNSPDPVRPIDLALWKFSPSGALLAGPYIRPAYLSGYDGTLLARVFVLGSAVYVTAPRERVGGGTDMGLLKFDAASGTVLQETFWRPNAGASAYPAAILADGSKLLVAGSLDDGGTSAGLWRYLTSGALDSAHGASAGGAQGGVFRGSDLWLTVDGSTSPFRVSDESTLSGNLLDVLPPRTALTFGAPAYVGDKLYATESTTFSLTAVDDRSVIGDEAGVGSSATYLSKDSGSFAALAGNFSLSGEGVHVIEFYSADVESNVEAHQTRMIALDLTPPTATVASTGTLYAITAVDPSTHGVASGVSQVRYLVDITPENCGGVSPSTSAPPGTCANLSYAGPFALAAGTHTVYFEVTDNVGNGRDVLSSSYVVVAATAASPFAIDPSLAPIGTPVVITGFGFGARDGSRTKVLFGDTMATISSWVDAEIDARVPALSTGAFAVRVERRTSAGALVSSAPIGSFLVVAPYLAAMDPVSSPIGTTATLTGAGFGPRDGSRTRVLFGGATAQISLWNDTTIKLTIPGIDAGSVPVVVERASPDGGLVQSNALTYGIEALRLFSVSPATGPVGTVFTLSGADLGERAGTRTQILIGATTAQVISWNDVSASASIPNLPPGVYDLTVQRVSGSSTSVSNPVSFEILPLVLSAIAPTEGPIGTTFTVTGSGFGARDGSRTRVTFGGTPASIISWADAEIKGRVPGVSTGTYAVLVERDARSGGTQASAAASFAVTAPVLASVSPSSAPIGAPVVLSGASFGLRDGSRTRVLFGSTTAQITSWSDANIAVKVPGALAAGFYDVAVERESVDGAVVRSGSLPFEVLLPIIDAMTPDTGPEKTLVALTGHGFGPSNGSNTRVLLAGTTVAVSVWSDTLIRWKVPTGQPPGAYPVVVRRTFSPGQVEAFAGTFTVTSAMGGLSTLSAPQTQSAMTLSPLQLEGSLLLSSEEGGRVEAPSGAAVEVPAAALPEDKTISVAKADGSDERGDAARTGALKACGPPLEFGPSGTHFAVPVTIEFPYDPASLPPGQLESNLKVHYYDPAQKKWLALDSVVDTVAKIVKAKTDHFSIYQPMGGIAPSTAAQDEFYLRDLFAYPNPVRGGSLVTFRILPGLADSVEVRVYDVAGRKVYSSSDFLHTAPGGEHQYENAWSVSSIGSGVYTFAIKAGRAGQKTIQRTGKVGVIK